MPFLYSRASSFDISIFQGCCFQTFSRFHKLMCVCIIDQQTINQPKGKLTWLKRLTRFQSRCAPRTSTPVFRCRSNTLVLLNIGSVISAQPPPPAMLSSFTPRLLSDKASPSQCRVTPGQKPSTLLLVPPFIIPADPHPHCSTGSVEQNAMKLCCSFIKVKIRQSMFLFRKSSAYISSNNKNMLQLDYPNKATICLFSFA